MHTNNHHGMRAHQRGTQPRGARLAHERRAEVQDLLNQLARAITSGDGETVSALWQTPASVFGTDMAMTISSPAEIAKFFGGAQSQYTERGIVDTRPDIIDEEWIAENLVVVQVRWPYLDANGHTVGAERSDYTLRRDDTGHLRVRSVLMRGVEN